MYLYKYDSIVRERIIGYKFGEKSYLYKTFVESIKTDKKIFDKIKTYDMIIPVPIHKNRQKERGYNQSELIAKEFENYKNILIKTKHTKPQSILTGKEREDNIKNVYIVNENVVGKNVLLIDDVYTTGATVNECSRVLKLSKAKNIDVLTIAKD